MAITNLALPAFGGRFETLAAAPARAAMQTIEVGTNLFFNLVEQRDPNYAYVYLTDQNPTTLVHTANVGLHAPNQNSIVESTRLFKVSANKVLAILGVAQDAVLRYRIYTFDAASKTVTAAGDIKSIAFTQEGFIAMGHRADWLQVNPTTVIMVAGMYLAYMVKLSVDPAAETITASTPDPVGHMLNGLGWQWMPGRNKWRLSGNNYNSSPSSDNNSLVGTPVTVMVSPTGDITKTAIATNMLQADGGYLYQWENGDQVGFSSNGRMVFTYNVATGARRALQVNNYNSVSTFTNSASPATNHAGMKFIHAIDDHHYVIGYVAMNSNVAYRAARDASYRPTNVILRYIQKVNDDVWIVSSNSLGANGVNVPVPSTIANDSIAYFGHLPGSEGFVMGEDASITLKYQFGARLQTVRIA